MPQTQQPYTIVVALDYSPQSNLALEHALALAVEKKNAVVHAVNVFAPYDAGLPVDPAIVSLMPTFAEAAKRFGEHVRDRVEAYRAKHPELEPGVLGRIVVHQRSYDPAGEIAQVAADLEADIIVVGTHGRRGMARVMMGSVAEVTARIAPCPVLIVRPKALPEPVPRIEPPCPRCVEARRATNGAEFWCEQHRERHGQRHTYHQGDRVGAETNLPLTVR
jgi:nucleotide-binding universal stress UspA family protein